MHHVLQVRLVHRFNARMYLHNGMSGYTASADKVATRKFHNAPLDFINEVDSPPQYTYNVNDTWLFWKKMPDWSYIAKRGEEYTKFQRTGLHSYLVEISLWTANWYPCQFIMLKPQGPSRTLPKHYCLVIWSNPKPQPIFTDWVSITLYLK